MTEQRGSDSGTVLAGIERRRRRRLDLMAQVDRHVPISFALVGVQKAATSTFYRMLVRHPRIVGGPEKEMRFFMFEHLDWSDPDYGEYARPSTRPREDVAGDATPAYFFWPHALERMQSYNPDMRVLLSLRDPIERAMSQWSMERDRDRAFPDVPEAIAQFADDRLPQDIPAGKRPWAFRRESLFTRGLYGQQLRRGFDVFGPEQWLVLDFRDVTARSEQTLGRATDFLGLPRFRQHPQVLQRNVTRTDHSGAAPRVADIQRLVDLYAGELADLARLSGLDVSSWSTQRVVDGDLDIAEFTEQLSRKLGLLR
jgi:hypothetical protein